jgi:hypothetical protein
VSNLEEPEQGLDESGDAEDSEDSEAFKLQGCRLIIRAINHILTANSQGI